MPSIFFRFLIMLFLATMNLQSIKQDVGLVCFKFYPITSQYKLKVLLHLDCGDVIYCILQKTCDSTLNSLHLQVVRIESVQYSAGLAIPVFQRQNIRGTLAQHHRMIEGEAIASASSLRLLINLHRNIQISDSTNSLSKLCSKKLVCHRGMDTRTERFESSFYPNCLKEWISLTSEIRESSKAS